MDFGGILGEDAPDPLLRWRDEARDLPMRILGLVPQPHVEDWGAIGVGTGTRNGVLESCEASISYTLWRRRDRPEEPANLGALDEVEHHELPVEPSWRRPAWLVDHARRMRYPMLW